jgi:4-hydroxy-2-oxoheptanedioate aldolase
MRLGTVVTLPDVALAELTASAVDLVWIDLEHGALSTADVQPLAIAARAAGAESFVRLASADDPRIGAVLDAGVDGVVVPRVERAEDARHVVGRLRYPPQGSRGIAARRASGHGAFPPPRDPGCIAQIESERGVTEATAIAAVEGVTALVIGCGDLAADTAGGADDPLEAVASRLQEAIGRVRAACDSAGTAFGIAGPDDPRELIALAGAAADIAVLGADVRIYARSLRDAFETLRAAARAPEPREAHVGA